jgi:hypothetical protein
MSKNMGIFKGGKMNPILKEAFDKTVSLFENDPRVVAAYHSGSVGTDREDEFSDVDPVFLIRNCSSCLKKKSQNLSCGGPNAGYGHLNQAETLTFPVTTLFSSSRKAS